MIPSPLERTRARFRRQIVLRIELAVKPTVRQTRGLHDVLRINHRAASDSPRLKSL